MNPIDAIGLGDLIILGWAICMVFGMVGLTVALAREASAFDDAVKKLEKLEDYR